MTKRIGIVDYGVGNLFSIQQVCHHFGYFPELVSDANTIRKMDLLILPGVGAFGDAMKHLNKLHLSQAIAEFVAMGKPLMGVCLGMQILFEQSEEFGIHQGLGFIKGRIVRFPSQSDRRRIKIPQIGWNQIWNNYDVWQHSPLCESRNGEYVYFVHSYYANPEDKREILSETLYEGFRYCSAVKKDNIFAFQFHPEKSGEKGILIYKNFLNS